MKFIFKAKTRDGQFKEGAIEAASKMAAVDMLQKDNLFPINLEEEAKSRSLERVFSKYYNGVDVKDLMLFFRQFAILVEARVPIVAALNAIYLQVENKYFQKVIKDVTSDIEDGLPFSDALKKHRDVFSHLSVSVIHAGELSGNLKKSVTYVAENIEKNYALSSRVKSAMMYPAIVLVVFAIIAFIVISFIVPKLTLMIKELGTDVPWYTRGVIGLSDFMSTYWWIVGITVLGIAGGLSFYLKTDSGKKEWDYLKLKLPVFGKLFKNVYITRFGENLSVLLSGGIPIIRALTVVSSVIDNSVYEKIFLQAAEEVKKGGNMSDALEKYKEIPPIVTQMVRIGEESGQIDSTLKYVAEFYEQETDQMAKNLSTLIEPVLMVVIGIAVGFLAFSVIMPIYNMAGQL